MVGADVAIPAGLTEDQAAARLAADGPNELPSAAPRSLARQAWDVLREPMLLLLLGAGTVNFLLADVLEGAVLMSFVVVVIGISIYQGHRTENALGALRDLSAPRAQVIRDGTRVRIPGRDVVRGDVIWLAEGDRVPADAVLVDSVNLTVDESTLTGESVPVRKRAVRAGEPHTMGPPGGEGTPWVFSGTLVVKGHGVAVTLATGGRTEFGRIGTALRSIEQEDTPLRREVNRLVVVLAGIGVSAAAAVVVVYGLTRHHWLEGTLAGIGTAMAMLPEEFPVVLAVFLALGAWRMSKRHVLTRRSAVIETLGSATVICVDKTGTLTMNAMTIADLYAPACHWRVDGSPLPEAVHSLAEFGVLASPIDPFDPMDRAFQELGARDLSGTEHLHGNWTLVREYPLSDHLLALSHVWRSPDLTDYVIAAKGAPEAIVDLCHLADDQAAAVAAQVDVATAGGRRVLAVARARFTASGDLPTEQHDFDFEYLGLVGLHDPVRPGVAGAVAECATAGVRVVMITGDAPGTAMAVAAEIGLDTGGGHLTGSQVAAMPVEELAARAGTVAVFARMVPEQKLALIRALRANGEIVGMTGDGVNDAPALRAADIGIAMGRRGTDVAREAAALVITDDDFGSIVGGIRRGRGIFDNLRKAMSYVIAVHVPIVGMALIPAFVRGWPLVLLPVQIAFLELIIDPACSVVFESEQIDPQIMHQARRARDSRMFAGTTLLVAVLQGVSSLVAVLGVYLWAMHSGRPDDTVRSVTFATLVVTNLLLILVNRSWRLSLWGALRTRRNVTVKWILAGGAALLVMLLNVAPLRRAFRFGPIGAVDWVISLLAGCAAVTWFEFDKLRRRRSSVVSATGE